MCVSANTAALAVKGSLACRIDCGVEIKVNHARAAGTRDRPLIALDVTRDS